MMKRLNLKFALRALFLLVLVSAPAKLLSAPQKTFAGPESTKEACTGLQELDPSIDCDLTGDPKEVAGGLTETILNTLTYATGAICVVMIIYGGFKFITSSGDSDKTKSARNTIVYAAVGLAIVILANRIIAFVFSASKKVAP